MTTREPMLGRTVLVTGASGGIGRSTGRDVDVSVAGVTGTYFASKRLKKSSARSYDVDMARRLWDVSAQLVGLTEGTAPREAS